jgi:hypothetical protein
MTSQTRSKSEVWVFVPSLFVLAIASVALLVAPVAAQQRSQGVSVHMLPKRVGQMGNMAWGFTIDPGPANGRGRVAAIAEASNLVKYFQAQSPEVQQNGLWIVITHPDAYSEEELAQLEQLKSLCRSEKIPLFICRASQLPDGWVRYDR